MAAIAGGIDRWLRSRLTVSALVTLVVAPVIVLAAYSSARASDPSPVDYGYFGPSGAAILSGRWAEVYRDPGVQAGPFELIPFGVAFLLGVSGVVGWTVFYFCFISILTFGFLVAVSLVVTGRSRRMHFLLLIGAAAVAVLGPFIPELTFLGHPADLVIPMIWLVAGLFALRGRFLAAGLVVALSAGWETWGVLGAPVVLVAAHPQLVKAAVGGVVGLAIIYLPFVVTDGFTMFEKVWPISDWSLIHQLWPDLTEFTWPLRLVQSVLVLSAGAGAALATRSTSFGLWLTPLAIVAIRLVTDPVLFGYYFAAAAGLAVVAAATTARRRLWVACASALAVLAWLWYPGYKQLAGAIVLGMVVLIAIVVTRLLRDRVPSFSAQM